MDPEENAVLTRDHWLIKHPQCMTAWKDWEDLSKIKLVDMTGNGRCEFYHSCSVIRREREGRDKLQRRRWNIIIASRHRRQQDTNGLKRKRKGKLQPRQKNVESGRHMLLQTLKTERQKVRPECLRQAAQQFAVDVLVKMGMDMGLKTAFDQTARDFRQCKATLNFFYYDENEQRFEVNGGRTASSFILPFARLILGVNGDSFGK